MSHESLGRRTVAAGAVRLLVAVLTGLLLPSLVAGQTVDEKYQRMRERNRKSPFSLFASPTTVLTVNQFQCGLRNQGDTCSDVFNSPTGGGGFWPTGSPNQYLFNSGLQVVGIIPPDAGFAWAGDTVGAFFMDASGLRAHGSPVTNIYDSLNPEDLENWPVAGTFPDFPWATAMVEDTALFNPVLIGRKAASQQDTWVMYWDGDPSLTGGRSHPMGILVEQRTLAWNYPAGNESIIYFIYKFTNVTNTQAFQRLSEAQYFNGRNELPDEGWRIDSIYVAFDVDPDITHDFRSNYATAILPFNLGLSYDGTFYEPEFEYPPSLFYPPFFTDAPGIVGVKYLKSPVNPATGEEVGLTSFSLHTNGGAFPDPNTVQRGWRYISLNIDPGKGDPSCTFDLSEVKQRRSCYLAQTQSDVRFFVGSGPFSLNPGESATIAVAVFAAATVATDQIQRGPSADNKPGFPSLAPGCGGEPIRPIEVAAGWVRTLRCPTEPGQPVDQFDVEVVPGSLLGKALVAQSIFDNKFLLGFAPEAPNFYLVPGDNQVTIVWEPSATEQTGDPFYAAAGDPENPLYDPNYRQFDVEGYRIYRGTSPSNLQLIAQFDKDGTTFVDHLCVTDPNYVAGDPCEEVHEIDIVHPFVQYPPGGVVRLDNGSTLVVAADTALAKEIAAGTARPLSNTGIPFAFVDRGVRNGFTYYYKVTAFDINSLRSGPTSLESAGPTKSVVPRRSATTVTEPSYTVSLMGRGDTPLPSNPVSIDPLTGRFSGPQPPTDGLSGLFQPFAGRLLPAGRYEVRIDSVVPYYYGADYFLTLTDANGSTPVHLVQRDEAITGDPAETLYELPAVQVLSDPSAREDLARKGVDAPPLAGHFRATLRLDRLHFHSGDSDWAYKQPGFFSIAPDSTPDGGSRWFSGENETMDHPTVGESTAGSLPGVTAIYRPTPYTGMAADPVAGGSDIFRRFYQTTWGIRRAADMKFYWGAAGLDSVIDVTHNVPVPFLPVVRASYGFVQDADGDGVLTWSDFARVQGIEDAANIGTLTPRMELTPQPTLMPVDVTGDRVADGNGFALIVAGEPYVFQVDAIPTNTVWTLRTYNGLVTRDANGRYSFTPSGRTPAVPGLRLVLEVEAPSRIVAERADLSRVHTVPDPYYALSLFDLNPSNKELKFVNLPDRATIRIYSASGILVNIIHHDDPGGGGMATWNLRNRSGQFVGSGVYFYHVSTPDGQQRVGKFTVINSGFGR